ncbi:uncharacterized protein BBA_08869 [Beauveria bassiana ARSEF 2860]|uniref:Uncharacterized protein n=1 Tax=Beauveria bassiana (strain ARSEF 2860) TaxID=655819 RepID=J4VUL4_BEAB2|nr:uncharacterized protein BBA_08869 [Beauveria bassiana ARSEF 2860]EJP62195.1 hypothetical protein BBA_08869 [Beauveria bassiana ARSEF 2860]
MPLHVEQRWNAYTDYDPLTDAVWGSTRVTGIESNPPFGPEIEAQESQRAEAPRRRGGSVDTVLCSVPDEKTTLREINRVLKLGSKFIFW